MMETKKSLCMEGSLTAAVLGTPARLLKCILTLGQSSMDEEYLVKRLALYMHIFKPWIMRVHYDDTRNQMNWKASHVKALNPRHFVYRSDHILQYKNTLKIHGKPFFEMKDQLDMAGNDESRKTIQIMRWVPLVVSLWINLR